MDAARWLGLEATHNPHRWYLPVSPGISTGHRFLFGGSGLGAAVAALEGTSGRPVVWATAQYLDFAPTGSVLDIDVVLAVEGSKTTQARATGHVGGTEILTVNAALGSRDVDVEGVWVEPPAVRPPDECPPRPPYSATEAIHSRLEQRWAIPPDGVDRGGHQGHGPGRTAVWTRLPELLEPGASTLGVLGDWVPMGIHMAAGRDDLMGNSLDNTLRIVNLAPTEWYLLDIRIQGVHRGFGHGYQHIWSSDGTLLAVASQSVLMRLRPADNRPPRRLERSGEGSEES